MNRPFFQPMAAGVLLLAFFAAGLRAQDVTVSPLQWRETFDPPDELPVLRSRLDTEFPAELKATTDYHYICYDVFVDAKGKVLALHPRATVAHLLDSTRVARQEWRFSAAKRGGEPANSQFEFAAVFNPKTAPREGPDAAPRLLEISPVCLPAPKRTKRREEVPDQLVMVELSVDANGKVAGVENAIPELRGPLAIAAKNWLFAPARQGGQNVPARISLPVIVVTGDAPLEGKMTQPPRVKFQARPVYPYAMRLSGMRGEVVVDFVVDIEGRVRNPYVIRSTNPSFDEAAIDAVRAWRFAPGLAGVRPTSTHMQVPIVFTLDNTHGGGSDGFEITRKADMSKLPEALRYDTPPRVRGAVRPVFPHAALVAKKRGKAVVRMLVDEQGRVADISVVEASEPEFGQALVAAIESFTYEPALKAGRPCPALLAFSQEFSPDERYQVSDIDLALLRREQKRPETIVRLSDLDTPLKPLSRRPPQFPVALNGKHASGSAMIEFLVDEEGRARLPRIASASDPAFGYAAIQGVADWRFEPPRRGGRATAVRVHVPVEFTAPAATEKAEKN